MSFDPRKPAGFDFQQAAYEFIRRSEDQIDHVYGDDLGVPTIGAGYALLVRNADEKYVLKDTIFEDFAAIDIDLSTNQFLKLLDVAEALNRGLVRRAGVLSNALGDQSGSGDIPSIDEADGKELFNLELQRVVNGIKNRFRTILGSTPGEALFNSLQGSKEMVALASMARIRSVRPLR